MIKTRNLTFGEAIEYLKDGYLMARDGWNGKNMFIVYQKGYPEGIPCNKNTASAFGYKEGDIFKCRPYLQMRCADGSHQMWTASQSDILADDWYVVRHSSWREVSMTNDEAIKRIHSHILVHNMDGNPDYEYILDALILAIDVLSKDK